MGEKEYTFEDIVNGIDGYLFAKYRHLPRADRDTERTDLLNYIDVAHDIRRKEDESNGDNS